MRNFKEKLEEGRKRWKAKSPKLFRKILKLSLTIGGIGGAIMAAPISLPVFIVGLAPTLISIGATGALVSKFTVENKEDLQ